MQVNVPAMFKIGDCEWGIWLKSSQ